MIQASGKSDDGRKFVLLGLSEENIRRLKEGDPILIDLKTHGFDASLSIFYGRTEAEMEAIIRKGFTVGEQ